MLQKLYPRLVARDFAPAGYAFQALKDLDMLHDLAKALQVPTPMSAQAASLFRILNAKGHGQLDAPRRAQAVRRQGAPLDECSDHSRGSASMVALALAAAGAQDLP